MLSGGETDKLEALLRVRDSDLRIEEQMANDLLRPDPALARVHIRRNLVELTHYVARIHSLLLAALGMLAAIAIILILK